MVMVSLTIPPTNKAVAAAIQLAADQLDRGYGLAAGKAVAPEMRIRLLVKAMAQ
jgi:hypothetical protein